MASSINASTTAGVVTTADTSGVLNIQTAGTTAISIDASQAVSFTNSPTVTGGTANGVAYLNGSKVLTTGSALVFDGSNLGVGVTPSAWASNPKAMQLGTGGAVAGWTGAIPELDVSCNVYYASSNYRYITTGKATLHVQYDGAYAWYNAPSGTAGNAITFTQAMSLTAAGDLLVGTTSAISKLTVQGASDIRITVNESGNSVRTDLISQTSQGQVGTVSNHPLDLITNGTGRARITSGGDLLVGTTTVISGTNAAKQIVYNNTANQTCFQAVAGPSHTGVYALGAFSTVQSSSGSDVALVVQSGNGSTVNANNFFVYTNGNVTNTNNSYGAISDAKLKENVTDATPKLEKLTQVRVVNFNMIDSEHKQLGVIAQELEQVFPGMVDESPDRDREGNDLGTTTKSVKYSVFVPMLIKAIQEQQALITQLTARITALEGA